jgi:hypothetical protein
VDFGGGSAGSAGGNHFGGVSPGTPGRSGIEIDVGGGVVAARDNYWRDGRPADQMTVTSGGVITDGALVDPVTRASALATAGRVSAEHRR